MDLEDCLISEDEDLKVLSSSKKPFSLQPVTGRPLIPLNSMMELVQPMKQTFGLYANVNAAEPYEHSESEGSLDEMLNPFSEETPFLADKATFGMNRSSQVSTTAAESWPFGCSPGSSLSLARISPEDATSILEGQNSRFKISPKSIAVPETKPSQIQSTRARLFQEDPSEDSFLTRPSLLGKRDPFAAEMRESLHANQTIDRLSRSGSSSRSSSALTCLKSESDSSSSCAEDCVVLEEESTPLRPKSHKRGQYGNNDQKYKRKYKTKPDHKYRGPQMLLNRAILGKKKPKEKKEKEARVLVGIEDVLKNPHAPKIDEIVKAIRESNNKKVKKKMARILEKEYGIDGYCLLPREVLLELNKFSNGNLPNSIMIDENGEKIPLDQSYSNVKIECACEKGGCKDKKCVCSKHGKRCGLDCRCRQCSNPSQIKKLRLDQATINDMKDLIAAKQTELDSLATHSTNQEGDSAVAITDEVEAKKQTLSSSIAVNKEQLKAILDKYGETMQVEISERFERERQSILSGEGSDFITLPSLIDDQTYIAQIKAKLKEDLLEELKTKKLPPGSKHQGGHAYSKKYDASLSKNKLEGSVRDIQGVESLYRSSESQDGGSDCYGQGKLGRGKYTRTKLLKIFESAVVLEIEKSPFIIKADCLQRGVKIATWKSISTMKGVRFKKLRDADPKLVEMIAAEKKRRALLKKKEAKRATFRESDGEYEYDDEEFQEKSVPGTQQDVTKGSTSNSTSTQVAKSPSTDPPTSKSPQNSLQPTTILTTQVLPANPLSVVAVTPITTVQSPSTPPAAALVPTQSMSANGVGPNKKKKKYKYKTPRLKQPSTTPQPQSVPSAPTQPATDVRTPPTPLVSSSGNPPTQTAGGSPPPQPQVPPPATN